MATAGSYFSAIIAATRSFPEQHAGLAIGVPCAVFGLSPLFLSTLAPLFTVSPAQIEPGATGVTEELDPARWLLFLAIALGLVNLLGAVGLREIPWEDEDGKLAVSPGLGSLERTETRPPGYDSGFGSSSASLCEIDGLPTERSALLPPTPAVEPASVAETQSLRELLSSPPFWMFGAVLVLFAGPCEMVMASLGGVVESLLGVHANSSGARIPVLLLQALIASPTDGRSLALRRLHVQVISISNTLSRLLVGVLSDYFSYSASSSPSVLTPNRWQRALGLSGQRPRISRLVFLGGATLMLSVVFLFSALTLDSPAGLWILSVTVGVAYGTVFTSAPAVVRSCWPVSAFGRNWGLLSWYARNWLRPLL